MYQKLEAMCVEVEETMYQDTVKYVEDQMRTVGATLKKIYSDVLQDLLPPSSLDPIKSESPLLTEEHHGDIAILKKPKVKNEKESVKTTTKHMMTDSYGAACGINCENDGSYCSAVSSVIKKCAPTLKASDEEQCTCMSSRQTNDEELNCYHNEKLESQYTELDIPNLNTSVANDLDDLQGSREKSTSHVSNLSFSVTKDFTEGLTQNEPHNVSDGGLSEVRDVSSESASVLVVSHDEAKDISEESSDDAGSFYVDEQSERTMAASWDLSEESDVSSTNTDIDPSITENMKNSEDLDSELLVPLTETSNFVVASVAGTGDAAKECVLLGQLDKVKLEESCVLVEKREHYSTLPLEGRQKSYKKKIRDVFSPKRWSKSKQEQQQLALWYEEQSGNNLLPAGIQKSQKNEFCESEWELL